MSRNIGEIGLGLKLDGKNYKKQVKQFGDYGSSQLQNSFGSTFKSIGKMAIAAFSIKAVADFTASCLKLGSDLTEVQNVVDVAFPHMNEQINSFAKNAMTQFGMSETVAKKYAGTFGAMSKAFGFTEQASADMAMELTGLAGDVASFYNMNTDEAYTKLKSVFTGETETLKELGVVMTQNALDQYALANGYGKTTAKMTEQEKVALRMKFVTDQLSLASGDFVRTQDSWANQTRVLSLRFDQLKASLGKGFIAVFTPIVKGINWVLSNLQPLADSFASLMEMLTGTSTSSGGGGAMAETASEIASTTDSADGLSDGLSDAGKAGEAAAKKINKAFTKTDTINKLSFNTDSDSGSSGGGSGAGGNTGSVANAVEFPKASEQANVFNGMLDGIIKEFQRLSNIFKTGFEIGFGNSFKNIERIKEYISSIGDSLKTIFLSSDITSIAKEWVDNLILSLGKVVGSITSIGITIGTLFVGSVATYLENNVDFIKNTIVDWFDISGRSIAIIGNFSTVIADIFSVFANSQFMQIGANIIQSIVNGAMNMISLIGGIGLSIIKSITEPIIQNKDAIKLAISEMFEPFVSISNLIADNLTNWDSFMQIIGLAAGSLVGLKVATIIVAPITSLASAFMLVGGAISRWGIVSTLKGLAFTIFPGLGSAVSTVGLFFSQFIANISAGGGIINSLVVGLGACGTSFTGIGSAMLALINPVTLVVAAIAGLAAGFTFAYTQSEDFRNKINNTFSSILSNVTGIIGGLVSIIQTFWTKGLQPVIASVSEGIKTLWNGGLSTFIENVSSFILTCINGVLSIWNNAINPLIELMLNTFLPIFTTIFNSILNVAIPIISNIMEFLGLFMGVLDEVMKVLNESVWPVFKTVFNGLGEVVEMFWNFVSPIFDWFTTLLGHVIDFSMKFFMAPMEIVMKTVTQVIQNIAEPIKQVFEGVQDMFSGVIDFITGVFTGDWSKAMEGIKGIFKGMWESLSGIVSGVWNTILSLFSNAGSIFSGVVDGIADAFKNIVNCIIDGINKVIAKPFNIINGLLNEVRSFSILGQKPFKGLWGKNPLPVPQIPKLAQGGYVKANQPQLAMIGDNRHQGEIVAPENKMLDMINTALKMQKDSGNVDGMDTLIMLIKELIELVKNMVLKVDIDIKKLSILLENAKKERQMIGG